MTGGWESFGATGAGPAWGETAVGRLLPTQDVINTWVESGNVIIRERDHEFVASIPWDRKSPFMSSWHHNLVTVRPGGQLLAQMDRNTFQYAGEEHPLFVTWELPEGSRVFACTAEISIMAISLSYGGVTYVPWEYYGDFSSNLMIYLDKRPVPQDVDLVHMVRSKAFETRTRNSLLVNLLEFIEGFGANTRGLMLEVNELNEMIAGATDAYIELRFEEVLEVYGDVGLGLDELEKKALDLKDMTLLWVYVIEWLAVTGTSLVAGWVLWSIMVRRRLYRPMGVTKLSDLDRD
jgi:hypothetical protein